MPDGCLPLIVADLWRQPWRAPPLVGVELLVLVGNTLVIVAVVSDRRLHTATNVLIVSLAVSDLLLGLFVLPFSICQQVSATQLWAFGPILCEIWLATDVWLCTAGIYNLVVISVDRYMAITRPLKYRSISSIRLARRIVVAIWLLALVISMPPLVDNFLSGSRVNRSSSARTNASNGQCLPTNNNSNYIIYSSCVSSFLPLFAIVALNCAIYRNARHIGRPSVSSMLGSIELRVNRGSGQTLPVTRRADVSRDGECSSVCSVNDEEITENNSKKPAKLRPISVDCLSSPSTALLSGRRSVRFPSDGTEEKLVATPTLGRNSLALVLLLRRRQTELSLQSEGAERRVAKTVGVVVGCFVVCWLPFSVVYLLQAYDWCPIGECISDGLFRASFWLGYCNSALNPTIYALFSHDIRRAFRQVLSQIAALFRHHGRLGGR